MDVIPTTVHTEITKKTIDIDDIFRKKNHRLYRWTPRFIIRAIERLVQQDEINRIIYTYPNDNPVEFSGHILEEFRVKVDVIGEENLMQSKRFIVASNHHLGALDGVALLDIVGKKYPDVIFPVNDILLFIPQFRQSFTPISKHGDKLNNVENLKTLHDNFSSDHPILYFPAGICARKQNRKITDLEWKKTFISLAIKYKRDIIPTYFEGRNSKLFYNIANFRKKLGIKMAVEIILLPREMFRQRGNQFRVIFAKPVPYSFFDNRFNTTDWAQKMREFVYTLKTGNESFETFINQKMPR